MAPLIIILAILGCGDPADDAFARASAALAGGDEPAARAVVDGVEDAVARDLLRLRLATAHPSAAPRLCPAIDTPDLKEKCRQTIGRPHLTGAGTP